jgi:hypothetical protein
VFGRCPRILAAANNVTCQMRWRQIEKSLRTLEDVLRESRRKRPLARS